MQIMVCPEHRFDLGAEAILFVQNLAKDIEAVFLPYCVLIVHFGNAGAEAGEFGLVTAAGTRKTVRNR